MSTFVITYDLNKTGQDYDNLYKAIKSLGEHIHPMQNVWFVRSANSSAELRDVLKKHVDSNDKLWVSRLDGWGAYGLGDNAYKWLKS